LEALAESVDAHPGRSLGGNFANDIDTFVQHTDSGIGIDLGGKRDNGNMTGSSMLASEDTGGLSLLLVLQ
jgi:hypothetical protein